MAISALLTAALVTTSSGAMFVTSAPKIVSLLIEPFSLLLMPGLITSIILAGPHDFSPLSVVYIAAGFYFGFFYGALTWFAKASRFTPPRSR